MKYTIEHLHDSRQIGLTLFRLALSFLIIRNMFQYLPQADILFGNAGISALTPYLQELRAAGLGFLAPTLSGSNPAWYLWIVVGVSFLFALGIGKWFSGIVLYGLIWNLQQRNQLVLNGSDTVMLNLLPLLILGDAYQHFTYAWPSFSWEHKLEYLRKLATWGFLLQVSVIYLVTGIAKVGTEVWFDGTANYYTLQLDEFEATSWNKVLVQHALFVKGSTWGTLIFELLFPVAILLRPLKYIWLAMGVFFHLGIWIFMKIDVFPWIMLATYPVFLTDAEWLKFRDFIRERRNKWKLAGSGVV